MTTIYRLNKQFNNQQEDIDLTGLEKLKVGESMFIPLEKVQFYQRPQKSLKARVHRAANSLGVVFLVYPERQTGFRIKRTL